MTASRALSGDQSKSETPPGKFVRRSASPASAGITQTWVFASSSPRSERKAIHFPSGLTAGWYSSASGVRVSARLPLPSQRARQRSEVDVSSSKFGSPTL